MHLFSPRVSEGPGDRRGPWELADGPYTRAIRTELEAVLWQSERPPAAVLVRRAGPQPEGASAAFLRRFSRRADRWGLIAACGHRAAVTEALRPQNRGGVLRDLGDQPVPRVADPTFVFSLAHSPWTWVARGINRQGFDHRMTAERAARRLEGAGLPCVTFLATGGVSARSGSVAWEQEDREQALGFRSPRGRAPWPGRLAPVLQEDLDRFFDVYGLRVPLLDVERNTGFTRLVLDLPEGDELSGADLIWT